MREHLKTDETSSVRSPIAVVAGGEINGLGVVRSLARGKVPIIVLDTDPSRPTLRTRYGQKRQVASLDGERFVDALLALAGGCREKPVLFLTQERSVATVSMNYDRIAAYYRISMPPPALMQILMDKATFQAAAEARGFPVPRAIVLNEAADLAKARILRYPGIMKPIVKSTEYDLRFKKAYKIASAQEMDALFYQVKDFAVMIFQEWIEGGDDAIYFCLQFRSRDQKSIASFTGRKLRSWPPHVGGTASCVPAPEEAPRLHALTDQFFSQIGYFGMGGMEYKRDARTGGFVMIEPTVGRTDFQAEVATLNGINLPLAAYAYEVGGHIDEMVQTRRPRAWMVSQIDRWSAEAQNRPVTFPPATRRHDAIARLNDPLPWIFAMAERVRGRIKWRGCRSS